MAFVGSRMFGLIVILLAIGLVIALWVQCGSGGCAFTASQTAAPTPLIAKDNRFGTPEIHITNIRQGDGITSPVTITGEAIPDWYIGGTFTVRLLDGTGHGLAYAQAQPLAKTAVNGFIPFTVTFAFFPHTANGTLLFARNLGSGLPNFPTTVAMPVSFPLYTKVTSTPLPTFIPPPSATPPPSASATPSTLGVLKGAMTIGPLCPRSQTGDSCKPSLKMFADRPITAQKTDDATSTTTITPGPTGEFAQELPAGQYLITMTPQILGTISGVPATITITAGKTTILNIAVNTGIQTEENTDTTSDGF